ncbi:hypothetical protein X734_16355 [Mesorhizobium sp. L2C084A000]|nr:hypothetical protein X734_16355 [Mesorhizobium sp. L2C084A000]
MRLGNSCVGVMAPSKAGRRFVRQSIAKGMRRTVRALPVREIGETC